MSNKFKIELAAAKKPVTFAADDILYIDGEQVTEKPLLHRKKLLDENIHESEQMVISRYVENKGIALYNAAKDMQQEGIIAKKKQSLYRMGKRTKDWIKCKALLDEDFIVCGYYSKKDSKSVISVILGSYANNGEIVYKGHVAMIFYRFFSFSMSYR